MANKKKKPNKWIQKAEMKEGAFTAKAKRKGITSAQLQENVLAFASAIAQQEGADLNGLLREAATVSKGRVQQANTGKLMTQGRTALSAMDRFSPYEEIAQTVAEYDFNETIGSDIEDLIANSQSKAIDAELAARQAQRASVEPPGAYGFKTNDQDISNAMGQLMAQAGRRAGKRRNR